MADKYGLKATTRFGFRHLEKQRSSKNGKHSNWALGFGFMCVCVVVVAKLVLI